MFLLCCSTAWAKGGSSHGGSGGGTSTSCSGSRGSNLPVTSIVSDTDGTNPFQLQSDTGGLYTSYTLSKTDSVVSEIQAGSCDWILDLSNSLSRTVALTFTPTNQASSTASPPFTGTQTVSPYIISKCGKNSANNGISYGTMAYGQTLQCGFSAAFGYQGSNYALRMEPDNFAGTNWVQVSCGGADSAGCNSWTVTPIPGLVTNPGTGQSSSIGELMQATTVKGQTVFTNLGLYYVAFSVAVHK